MRRLNLKWTLILLTLGLCNLAFPQDRDITNELIKSHPHFNKRLFEYGIVDFTVVKKRLDTSWVSIVIKQADTSFFEKYSGIVFRNKFELYGDYEILGHHPSGQLRQNGTFISDRINGVVSNYNNNELIHRESFVHGELSGPEVNYISKRVCSTFSYLNDTLNGSYILYFDNGNIKEFGHYKKGIRIGLFIAYYKNGKIKTQGSYSGNFIGSEIIKDSNKMAFRLNNTTLIDFIKDYSLPVKTEFSEQMKTGEKIYFLKEGLWESFNPDGSRISSQKYSVKGDLEK